MLPRRLLRPVLAGLLALTVVPAAASAAEPGVTPLGFTNGKAVPEAPSIATALEKAPDGRKWVRMFADWKQVDQSRAAVLEGLDRRVDAFRRSGAKIIMTVQEPPAGVDMNSDLGHTRYAAFMADMAGHFKGRVNVWELWNEPDGTFWTGGQPATPAAYTGMLKKTYPAIKAVDRDATVIVGGLVGNNYEFVQGIYANGGKGSFDGVAVHTDTSCRTDPPSLVGDPVDGFISRWAFTGYREIKYVMDVNGDADKGIYITELGWNDAANIPCADGRTKDNGVTEELQAEYLKQAFACIAADPYVRVASWFTLQDHVATSYFGLWDFNGNPRKALTALQSVGDGTAAGVDTKCGRPVDHEAPKVTIQAPALYFGRLVTTGAATDGVTGVRRIELWADGKKVIGQDGATFNYDWFGSSQISYGEHKIELRAYDNANNVGVASTTVTRANPKTAPRTIVAALGFKVKKKGKKFVVTATVKPPADGSFTEQPRGRLEIRMEKKKGKKWVRSRMRKGIGDGGVHYTSTPRKKGKWRVYAVLDADAPYKKISTKKYTFKVR